MRKITTEDIYRYYLGDIIIGEMYNSPIPGREDDTPSFCLFVDKDTGEIKWKDFGLADQFGKDPGHLLQHLREMPLNYPNYLEAWRTIKREVRRGMRGKEPTKLSRRLKRDAMPFIIGSPVYTDFELAFWDRFYIDAAFLREEWVEGLRFMNWGGDRKTCHHKSTVEDPSFIYWWSKSPASWKLYRPEASKRDKFRQEGISGVIEGWRTLHAQIEPGKKLDVLFINSASKDRYAVKRSFNDVTRWNSINPRGESDRQDLVKHRDEIFSLAKRVIGLYDADDAGYKGVRAMAKATGFEYYDVRNLLDGQKDFSDYIDKQRGGHSLKELRELISDICKL